MQKIILYYKFAPVAHPEAVRLWQRTLCEKLNLKGRIIIAPHGINGTLGGELKDLKAYAKETKAYAAFKGMAFKWSSGGREDFPRLSVKVRPEIVTFGVPGLIKVDDSGIIGGGRHLKPEQVHKLVAERPEDVVFFDGRNTYEAAVGRFKDAIVPDVQHSRDFVKELDDPKYEAIKHKPVVTYCTGGIRCEVLSMLMKQRGFQEVYQIDGGIVKYGEQYGDDGLWEGSLHIFDDRMGHKFSSKAVDIGSCSHCGGKTSNYENCANKACNRLILLCEDCQPETLTCGPACRVIKPLVSEASRPYNR
jgi:UPF0176 protein